MESLPQLSEPDLTDKMENPMREVDPNHTPRALAFELWMKLHAYIKIVFGNFNCLYNMLIRRGSADDQSMLAQSIAIFIAEFVTMSVPLMN